MYYTQDEFFALMEVVEADGGKFLDKVHEDRLCDLPVGESGHKPGVIPYCNAIASFEIPYKPIGDNPEDAVALIEVCAVDDWMGRWPRYAKANALGSP